jgi:hypothetical protein
MYSLISFDVLRLKASEAVRMKHERERYTINVKYRFLDNPLLEVEESLPDFGRSLLAGVCSSYSPHFVLSGYIYKNKNILF